MAIIDKIQLSGTVYTIGNETTTAVTSASTDNEIPTAKAVYDAIPQGGGGKAIEAGTNISITTGDTADTINCTLPISGGTGTNALIYNSTINVASGDYSHSEGYISKAEGYASHAEGLSTKSKGFGSHAEGYFTITTNESEHSSGRYNNSVSSSTTFGDSGNTLFSVGNGTADNARHNAFEIRQNGDIYINKDGQDVKLQDQLGGGGGSSYTAGDGIDITNDVISVTGKVETSAITTSISSSSTDSQVPSAKAVYDAIPQGGGGGITSSEVQTMIDESISGKTNQNDNLFTIRTNVIEAVVISGGKDIRIIFAFDIIQNNQIVLSTDTVNDKSSLLSALATLGFDNNIYYIRGINWSNETYNTSYYGEFLGHKCYAVLLSYIPDFGSTTIGLKRNNLYYTLDFVSNGKYNYNYLDNKPSITTSITSASTDSEITSAKAVYDQLGGLKLVKLTQSEYDALATKDSSTLYIING